MDRKEGHESEEGTIWKKKASRVGLEIQKTAMVGEYEQRTHMNLPYEIYHFVQ